MFTQNDLENPNAALQKINSAKAMVEMKVELEAIKHILIIKKAMTQEDIDACVDYLKTTPEYKSACDGLNFFGEKFGEYIQNPQKHLQDLWETKLRGKR
jgi:hypothetical protein